MKVRPDRVEVTGFPGRVSIHAPVKVRRLGLFVRPLSFRVSIHAPVKVRLQEFFPGDVQGRFNSRTCEGATKRVFAGMWRDVVSIHAPVKVRLM